MIIKILNDKRKGSECAVPAARPSPREAGCAGLPGSAPRLCSRVYPGRVLFPGAAAIVWPGWVMDGGEGCVWKCAPEPTGSSGGLCQHFLPAYKGRIEWEKPWLSLTLRKALPFQLDYSNNILIFHKIIISFLSKYSSSGSSENEMNQQCKTQ